MIDGITIVGANGASVDLNTDTLDFPVKEFQLTYDVRNDQTNKVQQHGMWPARDYYNSVHISIRADILAQDAFDYWNQRNTLVKPFIAVPERGFRYTCSLIADLTGFSESIQWDCNLDGQGLDLPLASEIPAYSDFGIQLMSFDPVGYSTTVQAISLTTPSSGPGGVTFPITFDVTFSGSIPTTGVVLNNGNCSTWPSWLISGPCSNPTLAVFRPDGTTKQFALSDIFIQEGDQVRVDFRSRTVLLNDLYNIYNKKNPASDWWELWPGTNSVQFNAINTGPDCNAVLSWQNAYILS